MLSLLPKPKQILIYLTMFFFVFGSFVVSLVFYVHVVCVFFNFLYACVLSIIIVGE